MITFGERPPRSADIIAVKLIDQYRDHSRLYPECSNDRFCKLRNEGSFLLNRPPPSHFDNYNRHIAQQNSLVPDMISHAGPGQGKKG